MLRLEHSDPDHDKAPDRARLAPWLWGNLAVLVVLFALVDLLEIVGEMRGYGISATRVIWVLILLVQAWANVLVMLASLAQPYGLSGLCHRHASHAALHSAAIVVTIFSD